MEIMINGHRYSTDSQIAKKIGERNNHYDSDGNIVLGTASKRFLCEELYQEYGSEVYYLVRMAGVDTPLYDSTAEEKNELGSTQIIPMTREEARKWISQTKSI